jgi:filamentous hemagglutinin
LFKKLLLFVVLLLTAGVSVGNNAVQISAGYSESENRASGTTYNTSGIYADNIVINTGNDATFSGANVNASDALEMNIGGDMMAAGYNAIGKDIDVNIRGDFSLESIQDTYAFNNSSWGINASYGENSYGGGGLSSNGNANSTWTNNVSSIVGTESVDIDVNSNLNLTGSMIANIDENGVDQGNLTIDAGFTFGLQYNF